jgi:hypothetical protein
MTESTVATHPQPAPPPPQQATDDVIFRLDDRPKLWQAVVGAFQHVTATSSRRRSV